MSSINPTSHINPGATIPTKVAFFEWEITGVTPANNVVTETVVAESRPQAVEKFRKLVMRENWMDSIFIHKAIRGKIVKYAEPLLPKPMIMEKRHVNR